jgi:hypothetical protein
MTMAETIVSGQVAPGQTASAAINLAPLTAAPLEQGDWPGWTEQEHAIARAAFDAAYARALMSLINDIQLKAAVLDSATSLWQLHDFLSIERHGIEGRFDFRPQPILFLFASLVRDELLDLSELSGLEADKLAKIRAMSLF